jgi:hypothetical protein
MGVSLIERRCYSQGMDALSDAVSIMKEISATSQEVTLSTFSVDTKLSRARQYLAHCERGDFAAESNIKGSKMNLCVLNVEDSSAVIGAALKGANDVFTFPSTIFLIRIELNGKSLQDCDKQKPDPESSLIQHNLANAYTCMACVTTDADHAKEMCLCAFQLHGLAFLVLQSQYSDEGAEHGVLLKRQQLHPIFIIVLRSLISLSSVLKLESAAQFYYVHMIEMGKSLLERELILEDSVHITAPVA